MKIKTTIWLLLLCAALWWALQFSERYQKRRREAMLDMDRFLGVTAEDVAMVSITRGDLLIECRMSDGQWLIERPLKARADSARMDRLLSSLEALSGREQIGAEQRVARELTLASYGLENPALRLVIRDKLGQKILFVGDSAPLGDLVYVQVLGDENVVAVPSEFTNAIPANVAMLRDRSLLHGDAAKTVRIEIDSAVSGFVQITRTDDAWMLQQPVAARADALQVSRVLDALFELRVQSFVWDAPEDDSQKALPGGLPELTTLARIEPYGLGEGESVRVSIWLGADAARQDLLLGKQSADSEKLIYAKLAASPSVYTVPRKILSIVCRSVHDFRDRRIFAMQPEAVSFVSSMQNDRRFSLARDERDGWFLVEPLHVKADSAAVRALLADIMGWEVSEFLSVQPTNLASVGLMPPTSTLELADRQFRDPVPAPVAMADPLSPVAAPAPAVATGTHKLLRMGHPADDSRYYAAMGASDDVFLVDRRVVLEARLSPENVLSLRDRTVLMTVPDNVLRLTVRTRNGEQVVSRPQGGAWSVAGGLASPQKDNIEDILLLCANLKVDKMEYVSAAELGTFGLDQPSASVTLGLTGETGIQKTILFGNPCGEDGVHAMVKGQDVRFVLPSGIVTVLLRDIAQSPPVSGEE